MTTEEKFRAAVNVIKNLPKDGPYQPSNEMLLKFYSYYKQATEGPCEFPKPAFWEIVKKAKWDAWKKLGTMTKEEAMNSYIDELKKISLQIVETMAFTDKVAEFMDNVGPFYEIVDLPLPNKKGKPDSGCKENGIDVNGDAEENKLTIFITSKAVDNYKYLGCTMRYGAHQQNNRNYTPIANGLTNDDPNEKPEWDAVESTIKANGTIPNKREAQSENFYSGSDSDEDEFSDPVDNDEFPEDKRLDPLPSELYSGTEDSGYNEKASSDNEDIVFVQKKDHSDMADDFVESTMQNGSKNDIVNQNGPIYSTVNRGGGDPMASRSTSKMYGSMGHQQEFQSQKGNSNVPGGPYPTGSRSAAMGAAGGQGRGPGGGNKTVDVNEQIALALVQLQHDMESVLTRLNTLEALTVAHHNMAQGRLVVHRNGHVSAESDKTGGFSWWPFRNMSFKTVAFFIAWPVALHILSLLISAHRARRMRHKLN